MCFLDFEHVFPETVTASSKKDMFRQISGRLQFNVYRSNIVDIV